MRGFVISWFFPPATSSEGIVTYKLLRNSGHEYEVCASTSKLWGYAAEMRVDAPNVVTHYCETASLDEFVESAVALFDERHSQQPFDFILTRSMPPESLVAGIRIKKKYPLVRFVASMGDPIANNPYELDAYVDTLSSLSDDDRCIIRSALLSGDVDSLQKGYPPCVDLMATLRKLEDDAFQFADMLICPSATQQSYTMRGRGESKKFVVVPHSYDEQLFPPEERVARPHLLLTYTGFSDTRRSLVPFVHAVKWIQTQARAEQNDMLVFPKKWSNLLGAIRFRIAGNHPSGLQDLVRNYFLDEYFEFVGNVSYQDSLGLMLTSDWLIHVDADFPGLEPGGSIFFAGKLADYLGAKKPIIALTGKGTPADSIVSASGGISMDSRLPQDIAHVLLGLVEKTAHIDGKNMLEEYRSRFDAKNVANEFDGMIMRLCQTGEVAQANPLPRKERWYKAEAFQEKLVTVCVPSYNVERFLTRCLDSLVSHAMAGYLDIVVVNDGSRDRTAIIAQEFVEKYPGIISLIDKKNGGHGSTINATLDVAKGRYFMVCDSDDWVNTKSFCEMLEKIKSGVLTADCVSSEYDLIDMETGETQHWSQEFEADFEHIYRFDDLDVKQVYLTLASSLFKTEVLRRHGQLIQEHTFYVDVEYILFPIPYINTVQFVKLNVYRYCRGQKEQSVHIPNMVARFDHHDRVMRRVITYTRTSIATDNQRKYMESILAQLLYSHYALMLVYDSDISLGLARAKDFDGFLHNAYPRLFDKVKLPQLKLARAVSYDLGKFSKGGSVLEVEQRGKAFVKRVATKVIRSKPVDRFSQTRIGSKLKKKLKLSKHPLVRKIINAYKNGEVKPLA